MGDEPTRVVFPLEVDEDGWPPVSAERVWAVPVGSDLYRLENAPWFACGVAHGDVVRAVAPDADSWAVYVETVERSGNATIRVVPFRAGPLAGSLQAVLDAFEPLGVSGEGSGIHPIVALTVPPDVDLAPVKSLLAAGRADGRWDVEEACTDSRWETASVAPVASVSRWRRRPRKTNGRD